MASSSAPTPPPQWLIPPVVTGIGLAVQQATSPRRPSRHRRVTRVLAGLTAVAGVGLFAASAMSLRSGNTTIDPRHPDRSTDLVTTGVYGWTRNPIYLADVLFLVANGLRLGRLTALIPVPLVFAWFQYVQIPAEEEALTKRFPASFAAYRRAVGRWASVPAPSSR